MKKLLFVMIVIAALILGVSGCREKSSTGQTTELAGTTETSSSSETAGVGASQETGAEITGTIDVNAGENAFVQTGTYDEEVTLLGTGGAEPSTVVVDLGDLVTLQVYSERLKATEIYNEDLLVDQTVNRGETVTLTIEANEEGIFYFTDKTTNEELFRFMIAGQSFG